MLKRVSLKENDVVSLQLRDDLFTLAQMRRNHIMQFFDVHSTKSGWGEVDLNGKPSLFFAFVAENRFKPILVAKVGSSEVVPSRAAIPRLMLSSRYEDGGFGADLVELTETYDSYPVRVVKERLSIDEDLELIRRHELTGMLGDAEKLKKRLIRHFDTGVNWDDAKSFLFKGVPLPAPEAKRN